MKKVNKRRLGIVIGVGLLLIVLGILVFVYISNKPKSYSIYLNEQNQLEVLVEGSGKYYVSVGDENYPNDEWILVENNRVSYELEDELRYYYLKYYDDVTNIGSNENIGYVDITFNNEIAYLAVGSSFTYDVSYNKHGYINDDIKLTSSEDVVSIDGFTVSAKKAGLTKISASIGSSEASIELNVSDLIVPLPDEFDLSKEWLPCGRYSKEENDVLDDILASRIKEAGYKTRAGAVACARFISLEFPYRVTYFYEFGRTYDGVDGEGRYLKKGLYLDESRFSSLIGSNMGPKTWGCDLYSEAIETIEPNGLDCSGLVTWILENNGINYGDIGSGFSSNFNLTDIGELRSNTLDLYASVRSGDLVHSNILGGHIGMVIGKQGNTIYVIQATPLEPSGVVISKYSPEGFCNFWSEVVLMDLEYEGDGNFTNMWN